jgi:hypothetical protein
VGRVSRACGHTKLTHEEQAGGIADASCLRFLSSVDDENVDLEHLETRCGSQATLASTFILQVNL